MLSVMLVGLRTVLFVSHVANDMLYTSIPPLLPLLALERGFSAAALGVIPAAYMVTASFLQMGIGLLYDKRPSVKYIPLGLIVGGCAVASMGFIDNYYLIIAAAVLGGVGSALFHPTATSLSSSSANRSVSVSFFIAGGGVGLALGALLSSQLAGLAGLRATAVYLPITIAAATASQLFLKNDLGRNKQLVNQAVGKELNKPLMLLATAAVFRGILYMSLITYLPLYLTRQGYNLAGAGGILTLLLLSGAAGMVPAGFLAERFGRLNLVAALLVISGLLCFSIVSMPVEYVFIPIAFLGFFIQAVIPLMVAESHEFLPNNLGFASALIYGVTLGLSNLVVPLVGAAIDIWGYRPVFMGLVSLPFFGSLIVVKVQTSRNKISSVVSGKTR
jgi:FSR family fosmidomycin resistance protein-like MFS transporter